MIIGNREFDLAGQTYIMGILNITPDSFHDGGRFNTVEKALAQTDKMISEGAHIIDVGGMSTRPGHDVISPEEELLRVLPVIRELKKNFTIPLSIDTYRGEVAEEALSAGIDMINDVWGGIHGDRRMADIMAKYNIPCCLMHNGTYNVTSMDQVLSDLRSVTDYALSRGVDGAKIIIDPGIGFAKDQQTSLLVVKELHRLEELNYPILLGASNKSLIGYALGLPSGERLQGTLAITAYAAQQTHIAFLRVHDVKENAGVLRMLAAVESA